MANDLKQMEIDDLKQNIAELEAAHRLLMRRKRALLRVLEAEQAAAKPKTPALPPGATNEIPAASRAT